MKNAPNPLLLPLAGLLRNRSVRVMLNCHMREGTGTVMREMNLTAPLFAFHRNHWERRMVVGIGDALKDWRQKLRCRGIELLLVSPDGLTANATGIADSVCEFIYRIHLDDLREMIQAKMPLSAISAFTGLEARWVSYMVPKFYGKTLLELRGETPDGIS